MPFVTVTLAGRPLEAVPVDNLHREVTALMAEVLGKNADLTAVLVVEVPVAAWRVGGRQVNAAAHIEAEVTAGTNTAEEKARFIAHANALLHRVMGDGLPLATYVVIHEIAADAWGYDGRTQERRRIAG